MPPQGSCKSPQKEGPPITHPLYFIFGCLLILLSLASNIDYPNSTPLGQVWLESMGVPAGSGEGSQFHVAALFGILFFWSGVVLLMRAFPRQGCLVLVIILMLGQAGPPRLLTVYQYVFAQGIMGLEYHEEQSSCEYTTVSDRLQGTCRLVFENHGRTPASFRLSFGKPVFAGEPYTFLEGLPLQSDWPLSIPPRTQRELTVRFETAVPPAGPPYTGSFGGSPTLRIVLTDGVRTREL
ncbi:MULTISPECIES: hypothetical protein [Paenibacillus]|uniref:hypothetical protein n=1 Tax=Paenibacillus TaxID=44249 RepID=UPI0022B8DDBD|nr:hypothetical protein [Paenibacillus caseinilyticus]MCZ8523174.1 hypothetical protein [Paenibacillus caseinilyticus]